MVGGTTTRQYGQALACDVVCCHGANFMPQGEYHFAVYSRKLGKICSCQVVMTSLLVGLMVLDLVYSSGMGGTVWLREGA